MLCVGLSIGRLYTPPTLQVRPCPGTTVIGDYFTIKDAKIDGPLTIIGNHCMVTSCMFRYRQSAALNLDDTTDTSFIGDYFLGPTK